MLHLQVRYSNSHRASLVRRSGWQPYGDGKAIPAGLAVVSLISPPHGAELRVLDEKGSLMSMETLRVLTLQPILGIQLDLFV